MGGLGLFLYGMRLMSDSLEKAAGAKMRSILEFFTKTPLRGILVGTFFTAIIQSSSAATVMAVSFVNSGLMNLYQAAGVIMGANIGTTITSQLIAFNLSELAPVIIMAGIFMLMFSRKTRVQRAGEVLVGFGILFMGLTSMSSAMSVLKESPQVVNAMGSLNSHFLALVTGMAVTAVLQSSSATVGIILLLANQGLLNMRICFFIILGCNIGACVSALIAGLSGKRDAKRAALIHLFFNIIGTAIMYVVISIGLEPITHFIETISGHNPGRQRERDRPCSEMADSCSKTNLQTFPCKRSAGNRTAYPGYPFPHCKRRYSSNSWRFRYWKNNDTAPNRKVV